MNDGGTSVYGDPCRECDSLGRPVTEVVGRVANLPYAFGSLLDGRAGTEQHPDVNWSVTGYVLHVADNLRIWPERLMGVLRGADRVVGNYDENKLADARCYGEIPLQAAMWVLTRSVDDWLRAVEASPVSGVVMVHPVRGELVLSDVVLSNAHDALHHQWDIERTLRPWGQ